MKMDSVIFQATLLLVFGYTTIISGTFEITTIGNSGEGFSQGSEASLTCTINPYTGSQTWKVNDVPVAECGFVVCSENTSNPERYSFTPNISTGAFIFSINPVEYADDGNIDCFDGSNKKTFTMVVTDPVVVTDKGQHKCRNLFIIAICVSIAFFFGIAQSACLGCIIYSIYKGDIKNKDKICFICWPMALASVPFIGIAGLYVLVKMISTRGKRVHYCLRHILVPVFFIIPVVIYLIGNWKYWTKDTYKILHCGMIFFIFVLTCALTGAPFVPAVFECQDIVPQNTTKRVIIPIIILAYYVVIWVAVFFELIFLQHWNALKFTVSHGDCMSCPVVDICISCKKDLCEKSVNKHRRHKLWKSSMEAVTCGGCYEAVSPARCVCLKCKKASCKGHFPNHLCEYEPVWSKHKQEWTCERCTEKDGFSAKNVCLECKTAFCSNCSCQCTPAKSNETMDRLSKEWTCEKCNHVFSKAHFCLKCKTAFCSKCSCRCLRKKSKKTKEQSGKDIRRNRENNCLSEEDIALHGCTFEYCEHLYLAVCLKCKTALCRDCSYLHFVKCLDSTLIWKYPQQALCSNERKDNAAKHEHAKNICLDCNAALCSYCSNMHVRECVQTGVMCDQCSDNENAVCLQCGQIVCIQCSYNHFNTCNDEIFCLNDFGKIQLDCYECTKAASTDFCIDCKKFLCTSCLPSCNEHIVWKKSTRNPNIRCLPCECPPHRYCNTCSRTVCLTCFRHCQQMDHDFFTGETIPTIHKHLIAFGCSAVLGGFILMIFRKKLIRHKTLRKPDTNETR